MNIFEKLLAIQVELKAPKNQYNSFGKYNYRNCEDILEAVKPLCQKYKAVVTVSDEIELIGDRYYIKATATLYDTEKPEELSASARAREEIEKKGMDGSQVTGASSSYARKYALNGLFAIDDTKDSDANKQGDTPNGKPQKPAEKPKAKTKTEIIKEVIDGSPFSMADVEDYISQLSKGENIPIDKLTDKQFNYVVQQIKKSITEAEESNE